MTKGVEMDVSLSLIRPHSIFALERHSIRRPVQHSSAYQKTEKVLAQFTALVRPGMLTPGRDGAREAWQCHKLVLLLHKFNDSLLN